MSQLPKMFSKLSGYFNYQYKHVQRYTSTLNELREAVKQLQEDESKENYIAVRNVLAQLDTETKEPIEPHEHKSFSVKVKYLPDSNAVTIHCYRLNQRYYVRYRADSLYEVLDYEQGDRVERTLGIYIEQERNVLLKDLDVTDLSNVIDGTYEKDLKELIMIPEAIERVKEFVIGGQHGLSYQIQQRKTDEDIWCRIADYSRLVVETERLRLTVRPYIGIDGVLSARSTLSIKEVQTSSGDGQNHRLVYDGPMDSYTMNLEELFWLNAERLIKFYQTQQIEFEEGKNHRAMLWWLRTLSTDLNGASQTERSIIRTVLRQCAWELKYFLNHHTSGFMPGYFWAIDNAIAEAGIPNYEPQIPDWFDIKNKDQNERAQMQRVVLQYFRWMIRNHSVGRFDTMLELIRNY